MLTRKQLGDYWNLLTQETELCGMDPVPMSLWLKGCEDSNNRSSKPCNKQAMTAVALWHLKWLSWQVGILVNQCLCCNETATKNKIKFWALAAFGRGCGGGFKAGFLCVTILAVLELAL